MAAKILRMSFACHSYVHDLIVNNCCCFIPANYTNMAVFAKTQVMGRSKYSIGAVTRTKEKKTGSTYIFVTF